MDGYDIFLGRTVSDYKIERKLRDDALGGLFSGAHTKFAEKILFRVLAPEYTSDAPFIEGVVRSAQALAKADSPYILRIFRMLKPRGWFCIAMRDPGGGSLREALDREGRFSQQRAASIAHQLVLGLDAAATQGVWHGDLHPENVLLTTAGRVKIANLGLPSRCEVSTALDQKRVVWGTPAYMSPEQCRGNVPVDGRSDLYAVGCLLFEMLTGRAPFEEESTANLMVKHLLEEPQDPKALCPELSAALASILLKLLQKEPQDRFQTAQEAAELLAPIAGAARDGGVRSRASLPVVSLERPRSTEFRLPKPRRLAKPKPPIAALSVLGVLALILLVGFVFRDEFFGRPQPGSDDYDVIQRRLTANVRFSDLVPRDNDTVHGLSVLLRGRLIEEEPGNRRLVDTVFVAGQPVLLDDSGRFEQQLELVEGANRIELRAARKLRQLILHATGTPLEVNFLEPAKDALLGSESVQVAVQVGTSNVRELRVNDQVLQRGRDNIYRGWLQLADGHYDLEAVCIDNVGGRWQAYRSVDVDTSLPEIAIVEPATEWVRTRTVVVRVELLNGDARSLTVNGQQARLVAPGIYSLEIELSEGAAQEIKALAIDSKGREAHTLMRVNVDTEAPELTVILPAEGQLLGPENLEVELDVPGEDIYEVRAADTVLRKLNKTWWGLIDLEEGRGRRIVVSAEDWAGNITRKELSVDVDLTAPELVLGTPEIEGETCLLSLRADEDLLHYRVDLEDPVAVQGREATVRFAIASGQTSFELAVVDLAGNEAGEEVTIPVEALNTAFKLHFERGTAALAELRMQADGEQGPLVELRERCLQEFQICSKLFPFLHESYYNMACAWALSGDATQAVALLDEAMANNFEDLASMLEDPDLLLVRNRLALQHAIIRNLPARLPVPMVDAAEDVAQLWWQPTGAQLQAVDDEWAPPALQDPIGMKFVMIPRGELQIGSPNGEADRNADETRHQVEFGQNLYLGAHEVTQAQFVEVMGYNPSHFEDTSARNPVEGVSWLEAIDFCLQLTELAGLEPVYRLDEVVRDADGRLQSAEVRFLDFTLSGYRLPTEAEWEYACRAGEREPFAFGRALRDNEANFASEAEALERPTAVGSYAPNNWGLFDMHGNVSEWCWDFYGPYPEGDQSDPLGAATGTQRVARGGSWATPASACRAACRQSPANLPDGTRGLRLVRNITPFDEE